MSLQTVGKHNIVMSETAISAENTDLTLDTLRRCSFLICHDDA